MKVFGVSLHYFDAGVNSDKFYRAFIYPSRSGNWRATYHWGRDGAYNGQTKTEDYASYAVAKEAIERKVDSKIRKGYEFLGQGDIEIADINDVAYIGRTLAARVGHKPTKIAGFSLVIDEEADLMELLSK